MSEPTFFSVVESPVGPLTVVASPTHLIGLYFPNHVDLAGPAPGCVRDDRRLRDAVTQLREYFAGARTAFDLPLDPRGTVFQRAVWAELQRIPFGQTVSYGDIARAVGQPTAFRAVGGANHRNPLSIIIPCHRVVGSDGSLTGYGGEMHRKRWLLDHEARQRALPIAAFAAAY